MSSNKGFLILITLLLSGLSVTSLAQVKITEGVDQTMNENSLLELESVNKGLLIPRVALVDLNQTDPLTVSVPIGMLVYSTGGLVPDGFYYWNESKWVYFNVSETPATKSADATLLKSETYYEVKDAYFVDFNKGIVSTTNTDLWVFEVDFEDCTGAGQGLIISSGTILLATAGNMVLQGNVTNNGSFVNYNSTIAFSGNTQLLNGTTPVSYNNIIVDPVVIYFDEKATDKFDTLPAAEGTLIISNLTGQMSLIKKYYEPGYYELNHGLKNGVYIVSFLSGTRRS